MTTPRPPLITRYWARDPSAAIAAQPLGRGHHLLDVLDRFPLGIGRGPNYDYPNPSWAKVSERGHTSARSEGEVWSNRLLNLLRSQDKFFTTAGRGPTYDYPNPRGAIPSILLRTHIDPYKVNLDGKDRFFRGPGQAPTYDYPNPRAAQRATVYEVSGQDLLGTLLLFIQQPFNQSDHPNPRAAPFPSHLRTYVDRPNRTLEGADAFFGLAGQPNFDWPVPKGAQHAIVLRTYLDPLKINLASADRFFGLAGKPNTDWPNPRAAAFPSDLRTHLDPLKLNLRSKDAFFGLAGNPTFDWPLPKAPRPLPYQQPPPNELPTLFTVLAAPFHLLDWPNPAAARDRGIAAGAWNEGWQNPIVSISPMPLSQYDWPLPRAAAYPQDLRVFYPAPFIWQFDIGTVTDTDILQKPVNVVMAGDVPIKDRWREFDIRPLDLKTKPVATGSPTRRLRGDKPSFTVKTDKKGYD